MKIFILILISVFTMSASNCESQKQKYQAPVIEDCKLINQWQPEYKMDWVTCYCVDNNITNEKTFNNILVARARKNMSSHPHLQAVMEYLNTNKEHIIKNKNYELPAQYCRGYSMTNPAGRDSLVKWAEDNRVNRIKCELGVKP